MSELSAVVAPGPGAVTETVVRNGDGDTGTEPTHRHTALLRGFPRSRSIAPPPRAPLRAKGWSAPLVRRGVWGIVPALVIPPVSPGTGTPAALLSGGASGASLLYRGSPPAPN